MAKSKLGIYYLAPASANAEDYCAKAKPRLIVSMEHNVGEWQRVKAVSPNTFIVGRVYVDDSEQIFLDDPEARATALFRRMEPYCKEMRGLYDAWMSYNEPVVKTVEEAQALSRFHVTWGDLMAAAGFVTCAYSFATGCPDLSLWPYLLEGLRHCHILSLHEYAAPTMQDRETWLCLRYRRVWELLPADAKRLIAITELGIDGGTFGRVNEGWLKFTDEAGYLSQLQWYDTEMQKDPYMIGGAIFTANGWGLQGSFGMGEVASIRDYLGAGGHPAKLTLQAGVAPSPSVDAAVAEAVKLIKSFEGFSPTVYPDPGGGRPTIGYGHLIQAGESYHAITEPQAAALLAKDLSLRVGAVKTMVRVPLAVHQQAALYSLVYNIGVTAFQNSTLLEKLNLGDYPGAAEEFGRWIYARGKILPGLVKRRAKERELFLTP